LKVTAADKRKRVAEEQSSDDAAYWPIYNLDQKNPSSADALEHRPPQELVDSILEKRAGNYPTDGEAFSRTSGLDT